MRNLLLTVLIACSSLLMGQHIANISLDWHQKSSFDNDGLALSYWTFTGASHQRSNPQEVSYVHSLNLDVASTLNVRLQPIETSEVSDFTIGQLANEYSISTEVVQVRDRYIAYVYLNPYRANKGKIERLMKGKMYITATPIAKGQSPTKRGPERTKESILAEGAIYKIGLPSTGIYKLTKGDLDKLGLNTNGLNPQNIAIYSNRGGKLPEEIALQNPDDLVQLPLRIDGEDDGKLDNGDVIYFYAEGPHKWQLDNGSYSHEINPYDNQNYAYIKVLSTQGKRVGTLPSTNSGGQIVNYYTDLQVYEEDLTNLLGAGSSTEGSGQMWFGPKFNPGEKLDLTNKFDLSNLANTNNDMPYNVEFKVYFAGRSGGDNSFELNVGNNTYTQSLGSVSLASIESEYAKYRVLNRSLAVTAAPKIEVSYKSGSGGTGWLDRVELISRKTTKQGLKLPAILHAPEMKDYQYYGYDMQGSSTSKNVWDITDIEAVVALTSTDEIYEFETGGESKTHIVFRTDDAISPVLYTKVANQNLHAIDEADMMVIYHSTFEASVDKFIAHRSKHSGLKIVKVNVEDIYPEFSSGKQDPSAIRDFVKMVYDRFANFKYLLIFGDGSYDFRGIDKSIANENFVPVYETTSSLNPITAFPTDDFYALLSDNEGGNLRGGLDIAVGRLTVTTSEEAEAVVNKIINYDTNPQRFGDWRLRSTFTADDEDGNTHLNQIERLIDDIVTPDYPVMNDQKIYFDAYKQETTPGGQRYPDVESAFDKSMDKGHLTFCYLGHGGPKGWAQERTLKVTDINSWRNATNMTLIITATCSFTGYDDPEVKSAGEYALLNPLGGAVGLFTTVRAVYSNENERLTRAVFRHIFQKEDGRPLTFGEIITRGKNTGIDSISENTRKFSLIGDPSQRLALPQYDITIDRINGQDVTTFSDTIGALQLVKIEGSVLDEKGALMSSFNGKIYPTVFDKRSTIETLGNDSRSNKVKVDVLKNILFKGEASVTNGKYSFSFVVPKDINYTVGYGKISLYATDHKSSDASGVYDRILIGSSLNGLADDAPPAIDMYVNDDSFESGDIVPSNGVLIINLSDDLGINVTGTGIGHDLTASLKGPVDKTYLLNDLYEATLNDYKTGTVRLPLLDLPEGTYTATVKAWDVSNKSSTATIAFVIKENDKKKLFNVGAYPNPTGGDVRIRFGHDLGAVDADITVDVFNTLGQKCGSFRASNTLQTGSGYIDLSLNDIDNTYHWTSGMYLYKIKVYSPSLKQSRSSKFEKIVKI